MNLHSVLLRLLLDVAIWPPKKSQVVSVFFPTNELVEHLLHIASNGIGVFPEPAQYAYQVVSKVRSAEQMIVETIP